MSSGLIMGMAALIAAVTTSVMKISHPIDKQSKKQENYQDTIIHSLIKVADQTRYPDAMLPIVADSTAIEDSPKQKEVKNRREFTNSDHLEDNKVTSTSSTVTDNHKRREFTNSETKTVSDTQKVSTYLNYANSANKHKETDVPDSTSTTFLESHRRREVKNATPNVNKDKFNSKPIANYHTDSSTILGNFKRKEVTNSTNNAENATFDSAIINKKTKTNSGNIAYDHKKFNISSGSIITNILHRRREVANSESTSIANNEMGVPYSVSAPVTDHHIDSISNSLAFKDYRRVDDEETADPDMLLPPTPPPLRPGQSVYTAFLPTTFKSNIVFPVMPKIDLNNTEPCDFVAYFCLKAYKTGKVCGRASRFIYRTFENYCMVDYINCKERTNVWKIIYMGECITKPTTIRSFDPAPIYEYNDDYFLDDIFVMDERFPEEFLEKMEPIHTPVKPQK